MAPPNFDKTKLNPLVYDPTDALSMARYQSTVIAFMAHVRRNAFQDAEGEKMMQDFCALVRDNPAWKLAQTVVPEFREPLPTLDEQVNGDAITSCLHYVLSRVALPPRPRERQFYNSEEVLVVERHRAIMEFLLTGGTGRTADTPAELVQDLDEIDAIYSRLIARVHNNPVQEVAADQAEEDLPGIEDEGDGNAGNAGEDAS